jgi:hypothetical protein
VKPSQHNLMTADIIERFTDRRPVFVQRENGTHLLTVG